MSGSTSLEAPPASPVDIGNRLEEIRSNHEEIERLEQLVKEDLKTEETSPMKRLLQGHRLRRLADSIIFKSERLVETYEKIEGDITPLRFETPWTDVSSAFSSRLQEIREYYGTHTSAPLVVYTSAPMVESITEFFTAEECFGRYLDLHYLHNMYQYIIGESVDYSAYLDVFSQPEKISPNLKLSRHYLSYMEALLQYLFRFFERTHPLQNLNRILSKAKAELEEQYGDKQVGGLEKQSQENELIPSQHALTDLVDELIIDVEPEKLNEGIFLRKRARLERDQLIMEAWVKKLCNLLDETIERTKQKGEKNQALAFEGDTESESGDGYKSRSVGWDGKPIPYWLDKLGLGQVYKCEICSNDSYAGKRAFERHFKEWRHLMGLDCFGLPNTEKLNGVASIEEAREIMLRERLHPADGKSDQGTDPNQAPAGVAIPPPGIRKSVELIVGSLSGQGLETQKMIIDYYRDLAGFEFMKSGDRHHAFYKHRLAEHGALAADSEGAAATTADSDGAAATTARSRHVGSWEGLIMPFPAEFKGAPLPPKSHKFTRKLPEGITGKELDIIKLAAQFWALYERCFWEGCRERRKKDPQFEFMKPPGCETNRSYLFAGLAESYFEVVNRPGVLKEELRKNAADVETVLERCFHSLQWDRFTDEHWVPRAREKKAREAKSATLPTAHLSITASTVTSSS